MTRRFQFSLGRSFASLATLCVGLALFHRATILDDDYPAPLLIAAAAGLVIAASIGVVCRRTPWLIIGAAIGAVTCVLHFGWISGWWEVDGPLPPDLPAMEIESPDREPLWETSPPLEKVPDEQIDI